MEGDWIKLHRKLLEWEWFDDASTLKIWLYILLSANYKEKRWHGIIVPRGSLITSRAQLSETLGISEKRIRVRLERLKSGGEIVIKTANRYTMITVCKYESYQAVEIPEGPTKGQQMANKGPQHKKERKKEYIETTNESKVNNTVCVSNKGGTGETDSLTESETNTIFSLFFLKFGSCATVEYGRFIAHYGAQGWKRGNGSRITDKIALAKIWKKQDDAKSTIPENFIKCLAPAIKKHQPPAAILYGIRAVTRKDDTLNAVMTEDAARWMEDHIADIRPAFRRIYGRETQLNYTIVK